MLGVPLRVDGAVIGVLHVGTLVPRRFVDDDVELLELVSERVALAIERARLHEQVVQLDQLKANFVAVASHELRTPAASVYGALATIVGRRDELSPEMRDELLQVGLRAGRPALPPARAAARPFAAGRARRACRPQAAGAEERAREDRRGCPAGRNARRARRSPDLAVVADPLVLDRVRHEPRPQRRALRQSSHHRCCGTARPASADRGGGSRRGHSRRSCRTGSSTASSAAARTPAAGSGSRSPARTRARTAATSCTSRPRSARASS